jgi:hypothetical protein
MKVCAARYALIYVTILKLQLVSWTIIGLTDAKFKPLIIPLPGFSLFNTVYISIYMVVYDYFFLCVA